MSADKCCSNVQDSRELAGFMNGNLPVREPCPSDGKEDTADPFANFLKENNTSDSSISGECLAFETSNFDMFILEQATDIKFVIGRSCNGTLNANEGKDEVTHPVWDSQPGTSSTGFN